MMSLVMLLLQKKEEKKLGNVFPIFGPMGPKIT